MEFAEIAAAASGLGGAGAALRFGIHMATQGYKERQAERKLKEELHHKNVSAARKAFAAVIPDTGAFVHRLFAVASFVILMAPIILPMVGDVTVHYYWPKNFNFFAIELEQMKEIVAGEGKRHIMILPFHITTCANLLAFYMAGKGLK